MQDNFLKHLLKEIKSNLVEQKNRQEELEKYLYDKLNPLIGEKTGVISVTPSNKGGFGLVVRFNDADNLLKGVKSIKAAIKSPEVTLSDDHIPKFYSARDVTTVEYKDGSAKVHIIYKYDLGERQGLALEHIMAFLLTGKITDQLKDRINLSPNADKKEVLEKLKTDFVDILKIAIDGKRKIEKKIGKVGSAESVGSTNWKADLVLTTPEGKKHGLSIKLVTEEGRGVRFTYNKNLGYGDEQEDNLVKNPSGKPWWLVGRQIFAKKVGKRKYNPSPDDIEAPGWMEKAKEYHPDLYKEAMEEVYLQLREVFVDNLRKMKLKDLVAMVNEAHAGSEEERKSYDSLLKLTSDSEGVKLVEQGNEQPDIEKIKSGITKNDIVKTDGARIIINIPGISELIIHGLKFHSNMLSSKRDDLKIKTR